MTFQNLHSENANACSKRTVKTRVATNHYEQTPTGLDLSTQDGSHHRRLRIFTLFSFKFYFSIENVCSRQTERPFCFNPTLELVSQPRL